MPPAAPSRFDDLVAKIERLSGEHRAGSVAPAPAPDSRSQPIRTGLPLYRVEELWEEITYLGYHLHWELNTLLDLEHRDRRYLVQQVASLNERAWQEVRSG